jgi:hypothetical protein
MDFDFDLNPLAISDLTEGAAASHETPCPGCGKTDWCFVLLDGFICGRIDQPPTDYEQRGTAKDGRPIYFKIGTSKPAQRENRPTLATRLLPIEWAPKTDCPQWQPIGEEDSKGSEQIIEYRYPDPVTGNPLGKVVRKQWSDRRAVYGRKNQTLQTKEIRPFHWAQPTEGMRADGLEGWWSDRGKGSDLWPLYRQSEINQSPITFFVAGEQAVETARSLGLTATCQQGGEKSLKPVTEFLKRNKPELLVIWPDYDATGHDAANKLKADCDRKGIKTIVLNPLNIWAAMPQKGDITDLVEKSELETNAIRQVIEAEVSRQLEELDSKKLEKTVRKPSDKPRLDIYAGEIEQAANTVLSHFGNATDPRNQIFAMGNSQGQILVRVLRTVTGIENRYLHVSKGNDVLDPVTPEALQWEINRNFEIYRWVDGNDSPTERRIDCPASLPKQILAMGRWPQLNVLTGLSQTPLLTKTGEVIMQPGYHKGTGYLLQFDPADFPLKEHPTKDDAIAALQKLKDLVKEFCFKSEVDRSTALSLLLTSASRKLYALAPLHAVSAHQPGTGKGTLIDIGCILATGNKEAGVTGFTDDETEMTKKMLATLLSGTGFVNIDNVDRRLGGSTLERVLTAEFIKERILGVSKNAACSTQVTWTANGNNLSFTPDMARRTVLCELDAGMEAPETRTFTRDIEVYTLEHRGELVSAALTVMQAFILAGSPVATDEDRNPINPPSLGSFGAWDSVVRRSLLWLGEPDPVQSQTTIRDADDSRITLGALLEAWHSQLGETPVQVRDVVQRAIAVDGDFRHAIFEVCLDRQGQLSTKLLGYYLRRVNGIVVNGYRLVRGAKTKVGASWRVEKIQPTEKQKRFKTSSPSSSSLTETTEEKDLEAGDDKISAFSQKKQSDESGKTAAANRVTMILHRHPSEILSQKELLRIGGDDGDDGDDISDRSEFFPDDEFVSLTSIELDLEGGAA